MFHVKHKIIEGIVSRETLSRVEAQFEQNRGQIGEYISKLLYWNKRVNLVSRDLSPDDLRKHIYHSLMIQYSSLWENENLHFVDAGSGGGLPGIPLAMVSTNQFELVDVVEKKMMACRDIVRGLGLKNVKSKHQSISDVKKDRPFLFISKHAFKLFDFINLTKGQSYRAVIFLKGDDYMNEIKECETPLELEVIKLTDYHNDEFFVGKNVITLHNPHEKSRTQASDSSDAAIQA